MAGGVRMRGAQVWALMALIGVTIQAYAQTEELKPLPETTLRAVLTFLDVDRAAPLDAHVVGRDEALGFPREKIVFSGARAQRVPAYLSLPKLSAPVPLVLLQHGGAFSKEAWWAAGGFHNGEALTRRLLLAGFAVAALDAYGHGERSSGVDYASIRTMWFEEKRWPVFRDMYVQTTGDHRRFLQYLESRSELDLARVGTIGLSMGGVTSIYLAAAEPRVQIVVTGSSALADAWLYPIAPVNLAPALAHAQVLLLAGTNDPLVPSAATAALAAALPAATHRVRLWESGHQLPTEYTEEAYEWVVRRMRR